MTHYFSKEADQLPSEPKTIQFKVEGTVFEMETDAGVFSKTGLDFGSRILLETVVSIPSESTLDLGCGYGPIGVVLQRKTKAAVVMSDVNPRALELARKNAATNKVKVSVVESDGFDSIDGTFDLIVTNPPIRAGKATFYPWFKDALEHLNPGGSLCFVIQKKQGAPSAIKECERFYPSVEVIGRKSGYFVIQCRKQLTI